MNSFVLKTVAIAIAQETLYGNISLCLEASSKNE